MRAQVGVLADELLATSKGNRDLLMSLVRAEVERSVTRLGLVSVSELESANRRAQQLDERVHELERELRTARRTTKTAKAGTRTVRPNTPTAAPAKNASPGAGGATKSAAVGKGAKEATSARPAGKPGITRGAKRT
jgi:hypothetical protein